MFWGNQLPEELRENLVVSTGNFSATPQQSEICVKFPFFSLFWREFLRISRQNFTTNFTTPLAEENEENFTPHFCGVAALRISLWNESSKVHCKRRG